MEVPVVDGGPLVAVVERPEHDAVLDVRRYGDLPQYLVEQGVRTVCGQVPEDDDDHVVVGSDAPGGSDPEEPALVGIHELDDARRTLVADALGGEPERTAFQGPG